MQHTFFLSLPFSLFLPSLLNPTTKPLLLVSDFYLVAPGPRFISQSPFSFSLDSFPSPSLSSYHLLRLPSRYRLLTARSLEQSGTSYSGFQTRRQGSRPLSSSSSSYFSFFGRRQSFQFHHLVPLIRDSLISRTTSVKIDNRASTRAATLGTATRTTFLFV